MKFRTLLLPALIATLSGGAQAVSMLDFGVGDRGYGTQFLAANDDGSTNQLPLPFDIDFFGQTFSNFFVNNNGNISFLTTIGAYTPDPFPISSQPMIAPFWGDVDTRGTGNVWIHSPNANTLAVTWDAVGYYDSATDKTNSFQLVLRNQGDGNFDVDFRYERLEWTTGDASDGANGLGGIPAQSGYDAGDGVNYLTLPGSRTGDVLNLQHTTNVAGGEAGLWSFAIRNGQLPGSSASNPLMPVASDEGWNFDFNVVAGTPVFIDPDIAIGYDYIVNSGPSITSVLLPTFGDGLYDLWLWNGEAWVASGDVLSGGVTFTFAEAVTRFRILGIEEGAALDPLNPTAFVTGLTFSETGPVSMSQNPIVVTVPVPEPETYAMFLAGLGLIAAARRRRVR
ncbi:nidogen-like domain-containing protein [Methyloversatilis discipulorum]|uniref:nidogen-like domain-containing protein n=1 Tax=Methyloversatilis discipulorum TaxID=1119528 RepID=UPI001A580829|nr:nidogen-like domain-containing protein [Methyloversatilis discipulorum]MBL8466525.1 PEP-CTERM sorting domain-containing protein [Methyloversatilis discipulorum]